MRYGIRVTTTLSWLPSLLLGAAWDVALSTTPEQDFEFRRSQPGVGRWIGFDTEAEVTRGVHPDGAFESSGSGHDTSVKASGAGSLRFTVPSKSGSNSSGAWKINFSDYPFNVTFGAGEEFFVQWRQRFDSNFINTKFTGSAGWKQVIVGEGDRPGAPEANSCTELELVTQSYYLSNFPILYHACGYYAGFYEPFGSYDFKLQNAMPAPYCLYSDATGCFHYQPNEWMTFQLRVKLGPRGTAYSAHERTTATGFTNSTVEMWIAREGQPARLVHSWSNVVLRETAGREYGKLWLTPYQTGKDASVAHPVANTWYDELIISTQRIPDPGSTSIVAPRPPSDVRVN